MVMSALAWLIASPLSPAAGFTKGRAVKPFTPEFKSADYVWRPKVSPTGLMVIRPTAAIAWSHTGAATSMGGSSEFIAPFNHGSPLNPQAITEVHRILKANIQSN